MDFRYLGKGEVSIVDLRDITMGKAHYGADTRLPGMKYAVIARPPVTGGKLVSFDGSAAMKVPGVEKVMEVKGWPWPSKFQPLGGVAVIARNTGAAIVLARPDFQVYGTCAPGVAADDLVLSLAERLRLIAPASR